MNNVGDDTQALLFSLFLITIKRTVSGIAALSTLKQAVYVKISTHK